jgi:integrase
VLGSRGPRRREPEGHGYVGAHRRPAGDLRTQVDSVAAHRATIPAVIAVLRKHRTEQKAERLRAGNQWHDSGLIFTTEFGGPVDPRNLLRMIAVAAKAAGVDGIGVHTLRHSAAVAWLEAGGHIKTVADLLEHSSIAITGDVYGHTSDDTVGCRRPGGAARAVTALLPGPKLLLTMQRRPESG